MQSPGNPQTLNRYSYCLNNPLAYIDPTGNIVEFPNEAAALEFSIMNLEFRLEIPSWVMEWAYSRCAWEEFREASSDLAQALRDSPFIYEVRWDPNMPKDLRGDLSSEAKTNRSATWAIRLNPNSEIWGDPWKTLNTFAEEAFHVICHPSGTFGNTKDEEIVAKSFSWWVTFNLGYVRETKTVYARVVPWSPLEVFKADIDRLVTALVGYDELKTRLNSDQLEYLRGVAKGYWP